MAQRRMTSLEVIDTDAFLDMPVSSQLLYFHLNARADDDGFVASPKKIVRTLGAAGDDFKLLIAKKFVIAFEDGVCVIKHWRVNNFIRKDIYKETQYLDLKRTLFIRPNGTYTQTDDGRAIAVPDGHFKVEAVESTLTSRQLRIGKDREGKDISSERSSQGLKDLFPTKNETPEEPLKKKSNAKYPNAKKIFALFGDYPKFWERNTTFLLAAEEFFNDPELGFEEAEYILKDWYPKNKDRDFCPQIFDPKDLLNKHSKLEAYSKKHA